MDPLADLTTVIQLMDKVAQVLTGSGQLITALATLIATIAGRAVSGRPILAIPAAPGQPRPRILSPKAVLKGWIATLLATVILWTLAGFAYGMFLARESPPPQRSQQEPESHPPLWSQQEPESLPPRQPRLEPESLTPQQVQQGWMEFMGSERGTAVFYAITALACVFGAHSAAKQAKCFRLTYAFLSIGSLYLAVGLIAPHYFPVQYAEAVAYTPPSLRNIEFPSALIGTLLGGILGA